MCLPGLLESQARLSADRIRTENGARGEDHQGDGEVSLVRSPKPEDGIHGWQHVSPYRVTLAVTPEHTYSPGRTPAPWGRRGLRSPGQQGCRGLVSQRWFRPGEHQAMSGDSLVVTDGGRVFLASSGCRPRMLLDTLQSTGPLPQQNPPGRTVRGRASEDSAKSVHHTPGSSWQNASG